MNIGITGHSKEIGREIYQHFILTHEIKGFSRTNGYDISKDIPQIYSESKDTDVFINNAQQDYYQTKLLSYFYDKGYDGHMISIGSLGAELTTFQNKQYPIQKSALMDTNTQLYMIGHNVTLINFGYVNTKAIAQKAKKEMNSMRKQFTAINPAKPMNKSDIPRIIEFILDSPHRVKSLSVSM